MDQETIIAANTIKFEVFCDLLEELFNINTSNKKNKKDEQVNILSNFINKFRLDAANITAKKDCNFYPILRLLLPNLERERSAYNLKEKKLGELLVRVLSLHKTSIDAKKILNFRAECNTNQGSDLPGVAYYVLKKRVCGSSCLTIKYINDVLDKISNAEVGNKGKTLDEEFTQVIKQTTPKEQKWFLRIVLKDLKIGLGTKRILSAYHPDAVVLYDNCSSLSKVCEELDESNTRPLELGVQLFSAISPMLSERLDVRVAGKLEKTYLIENKFDGERFQIHMKDGTFEYFSRRGFKYSDKFGSNYSAGNLTPFLKDSFSVEAQSFIMDGEMMGWHKEKHCFSSKGIAFDVKKITDNSKYKPCFCAFDLMYYNGRTLVGPREKGGVPLTERLKLLDQLFIEIPGVIYHSKRSTVENSTDILNALKKAHEQEQEGIVVKEVDSYYLPSKRNAGWYKLKPEYTEGTMEDLDLVIIGGDYAENKKQGMIKSFLVALADTSESGDTPTRWVSVGRVASGLSDDEREQLCRSLQGHWNLFSKEPSPACLVWNRVKPDLWIHPDHSTVLEVRASELILSKEFAAPYTLRFPRVLRVRYDKPVRDATTVEQFNALIKDKAPVIKMSTGQINSLDVEAAAQVRVKRKRQTNPIEVADHFKAKRTCDVPVTSQALSGRTVCVLSGFEECSKEQLEDIVLSHGGSVVSNINSKIWCCIAGRKTAKVKQAIDSLTCDIISAIWLQNLPQSATPVDFPSPVHTLALRKETGYMLAQHFDRFGDSYHKLIDEDDLRMLFQNMDSKESETHLTTEEMLLLDEELFDGGPNPYSFLRRCYIHSSDPTHIFAIQSQMYGATICDITSPSLTHILINDIKDKYIYSKENVKDSVHFVSINWLKKCFDKRELLAPECDIEI